MDYASRLVDNFGNDLGEVIEVDMMDSGDPDTRAYMVYVKNPSGPGPREGRPVTFDDIDRWNAAEPTDDDLVNWREADDYRDEGFDGE